LEFNPENEDMNMVKSPSKSDSVPSSWCSSLSPEFDTTWSHAHSFGSPPNYKGHIYDEDILNGVIPVTDEYFGSKAWLYWAITSYLGKNLAKLSMKIFEPLKKALRIA